MTTFRKWFDAFTERTGEVPESVVMAWEYEWRGEDWPEWDRWGIVTPFGEVPAEIMDYEFSDYFGGNESPNVCAWSPSWVIGSDDYDGAESLFSTPRHPVDHVPVRPGGG